MEVARRPKRNGTEKALHRVDMGGRERSGVGSEDEHRIRRIAEKNREISDSLEHAALIQKALLPKERHFSKAFEDHFTLHLQKEGVGGDLYWFAEKNGIKYFAVADCTGHGVPGALLAVLSQSFLNYIVHGKEIYDVSGILMELDRKLINAFRSNEESPFQNDWVDISLCAFDPERMECSFAGAQRSILHVKGGEHLIHKGTKYPVGGWQVKEERIFPSISFPVEKGEALYLGSDGFQDQFGGSKDKKFTRKHLHELIVSIRERSMEVQKEILWDSFRSWKGSREQVDDVCLMGIRF